MASLICLNFKNKFYDLLPIQIHNQREDATDELIVKPERSYFNYRLNEAGNRPIDFFLNYEQEYKKIMKQFYKGKRNVRKDATVMCSLRVTSNKSFFENQEEGAIQNFFESNYKFLKSYFGKDKVIDSIVHLDERIPHMHFCFVPLTNDGRLCAKTIFDRKGLTLLHARALANIRAQGFDITKADEAFSPLKTSENLKRSILEKEIQKLENKINEYRKIDIAIRSVDDIPFKRTRGLFRGEMVNLTDDNFSKLRSIAKFGVTFRSEFDKLLKENERLRKRYDDHILLINDLRAQIEELTKNRDELLLEGMEVLSTIKSDKSLYELYEHIKSTKEHHK